MKIRFASRCLAAVCLAVLSTAALARDEVVERRVTYQGQLQGFANATVQIFFRMYDQNGNPVWGPEGQQVTTDDKGNFAAVVGATRVDLCRRLIGHCNGPNGAVCTFSNFNTGCSCIFTNIKADGSLCCPGDASCTAASDNVPDFDQLDDPNNLYLEVSVQPQGEAQATTLSPRQRLLPAFHAASAQWADGVRAGNVTSGALAANVIDSSKIADGTITSQDVATGSSGLTGDNIVDGAIKGADVAIAPTVNPTPYMPPNPTPVACDAIKGTNICKGTITGDTLEPNDYYVKATAGGQSVPINTQRALSWNAALSGNSAMLSGTHINILRAGVYLITATVSWGPENAVITTLKKNGTTQLFDVRNAFGLSSDQVVTTIELLDQNDYLEVYTGAFGNAGDPNQSFGAGKMSITRLR